MANYNKQFTDTAARLGEVRFSYAHVFEPKANPAGVEKYSVMMLIPKTDKATIDMINKCIDGAITAGTATKWAGKQIPKSKLRLPLRDGDEEHPDDAQYAGMYFMNASASATQKPGVAVLEGGNVVDAFDEGDFYSGCWGCASVNFFAYSNAGNNGISVGLNNVIKTRDDTKLSGGGHTAASDFGDLGM